MSGIWDRTLVYLGLREEPDDAYDGFYDDVAEDASEPTVARFDAVDDPHAEHAPRRPAQRRQDAAARDEGTSATAERTRAERPVVGERREGRPADAAARPAAERDADRNGRGGAGGREGSRPERTRSGTERRDTTGASSSRAPATGSTRSQRPSAAAARDGADDVGRDPAPSPASGRPIRREPERGEGSNVTRLTSSDIHVLPVTRGATVRVEILTIATFDEVERIGRAARAGEPVLFDLRDADATTARRVVDVASGVVYALHGTLERVGARAFLLRPRGVALPPEERRRLDELGYRVPAGSEA